MSSRCSPTSRPAPERRSRYELHLPYTIVLRLGWGGEQGMVYFFASQPVEHGPLRRLLVIGRNYDFDQPAEVLQDSRTRSSTRTNASSSPSARSRCRSTSPPSFTSSSTRWRSPTAGRCVNQASRPTERQAFAFWLKLGMISFGGPAGQIAIMHDQLVERRRWISERRFRMRSTSALRCRAGGPAAGLLHRLLDVGRLRRAHRRGPVRAAVVRPDLRAQRDLCRVRRGDRGRRTYTAWERRWWRWCRRR